MPYVDVLTLALARQRPRLQRRAQTMSIHRSGTLLTRGPLLRAVLAFGWPLVAGMAFHSLFNLVDLYIVGQLPDSDVAIAAASIPSLVNSIPMIIYNGIVNAAIALVARNAGTGCHRRGNYEAGQGILLSVLLGVVFGVPPFLFARRDLRGVRRPGRRPRAGDHVPAGDEPRDRDHVPAAPGDRGDPRHGEQHAADGAAHRRERPEHRPLRLVGVRRARDGRGWASSARPGPPSSRGASRCSPRSRCSTRGSRASVCGASRSAGAPSGRSCASACRGAGSGSCA